MTSTDRMRLDIDPARLSHEAADHLVHDSVVAVPWDLALALLDADERDEDNGLDRTLPHWLDEDDRYYLTEALGRDVPPPNRLVLQITTAGVRGRPGYGLGVRWVDDKELPLDPQPERIADGLLSFGGVERRLTASQHRALAVISTLSGLGRSRDADLGAAAEVHAAVDPGDASVSLGPGIRAERVLRVDSVTPYFAPRAEEGRYQLRPRIEGVPDDKLWAHVRQLRHAHHVGRGLSYADPDGIRVRPVLTERAKLALLDVRVKASSNVDTRTVAQVIADPGRFLGPHLDLSELADRVTGIGPIVLEARREHSEVAIGDWTGGWDLEMTLEGLDGEDAAPLDLKEPSTVAALEASIAQADADGVGHIPNPVGPGLIQVTMSLRSAVKQARAEIDGQDDKPGGHKHVGLQVRDNVESLSYNEAEADLRLTPAALRRPRGLKPSFALKPHQLHGFAWLMGLIHEHSAGCRGALLADDMGLGKTIQVLALLSDLIDEDRPGPHLIVAPVALLDNWQKEARKFFGERLDPFVIFRGNDPRANGPHSEVSAWLARQRIVAVSYATLRKNEFVFAAVSWDLVVMDEAQRAKNPDTQTARVVRALPSRFRLGVTGTPVENSLRDLWTIYDWAIPGLLGSLRAFRSRFITPIAQGAEGADRSGLAAELTGTIEPVFMRRMKQDVLDDLPEIHHYDHQVSLTAEQESRYGEVLGLATQLPGSMLTALPKLFAICAHPDLAAKPRDLRALGEAPFGKAAKLFELLDAVYAAGEKALIFANRRAIQHWLADEMGRRYRIPRPKVINGEANASRGRTAAIDRFSDTQGFACLVLAPRAAGVGLNITAANHVIHYMREWNPAVENQATDRCYRIGQTRDVHVHTITSTSPRGLTVEQRLGELLEAKRRLISEFAVPMGSFEIPASELANLRAWAPAKAAELVATLAAEPALPPARAPAPDPSIRAALAARIAAVELPDCVVDALSTQNRAALVLLADKRRVRTQDMARVIGLSPARVSGVIRQLAGLLHSQGHQRVRVTDLPDGTQQFHYMAPNA